MLDATAIPRPVTADDYASEGKPSWLKESFSTWHGLGGPLYGQKEFGRFVRAYLGTLLSVDESVGRIYEALRNSGQLDNTVIVFTSDNGFVLGEHGRVDKRTAYEESLRVPLLVRYPPLAQPGTVVSNMVLNVDLAPSLVDLGNGEPLRNISGHSWKPLLRGWHPAWRSSFVYEYNFEKQFPYTPNVRAIRTGEWKYIRYPHGDGSLDRFQDELYHLTADPLEQRNLAVDPAYRAQRDNLASELQRLSRDIGPDRMPIYGGITNVLPKY